MTKQKPSENPTQNARATTKRTKNKTKKTKPKTKKLSTKKRKGLAAATAKNKSSQTRVPKIRQKAAGSRQKETEGHHCNHHQATTTVELPEGGCTGEKGEGWQTGISLPRGAVGHCCYLPRRVGEPQRVSCQCVAESCIVLPVLWFHSNNCSSRCSLCV